MSQHATDIRSQLDRDGFCQVAGVLSGQQVQILGDRVEKLFTSKHPRSRQVLYVDGRVPAGTPHLDRLLHQWLNPHRYTDGLGTSDLLAGPRAVARSLLGVEPTLFQDLLLVKEPGQKRFPWHQDFPFWPVDSPRGVVCWIPLIHSERAAGGLRCARGSHRIGALGAVDLHRGVPQDDQDDGGSPNWPDVEAQFEICVPPIEPGGGLFFSPLLFHSSAAKTTPGRRIAWSSIWLHPDVRWCHARAPNHPLCARVRDGAPVGE